MVHLVLRPVNLALAREAGVDKAEFDLTRRVSVPLVRLQEAEPIGKGEAHGGQSSARGRREEGEVVQATCEERRQRGNGGGKDNYATSGRVSVSQGSGERESALGAARSTLHIAKTSSDLVNAPPTGR